MVTTLRYGALCCLIYASLVLSIKSKQEVYNHLFASGEYNRNLRPEINNGEDPVMTNMMPILMRIRGLHENNEILQSTFFMHMEWTDPRLAWNNTDLDHISQIIVPTTHVWTPDIVLYNSASPAEAQQGHNVIVKKDGSVSWVPMYDFDSECDTDLYDFPYDTQACELQIGSWSYVGTELMMKFPGTKSNKSSLYVEHEVSTKENLEWELVNYEDNMEIRLIDYECCEPSPTLHINIRLRRRPNYFHYVIIAPAVLFSFLIPVIFIFPYHAGERTALGTLVLFGLCYLLYMQVVVQISVTRIVKFYVTSMVLATLAIALSAIVKAIADQGSANKATPKWLNSLLASSVGKCFGVQSNYDKGSKHQLKSSGEISNLSAVKNDDVAEPSGKLIFKDDAKESQDAINQWNNAARLLDRVLLVVFMILFIVTSLFLLA